MPAAPSLGKRLNLKSSEASFLLLPLSREHVKSHLSKRTVLTVGFLWDPSNVSFQECRRALFSPEIVQAGAAKGLMLLLPKGGQLPVICSQTGTITGTFILLIQTFSPHGQGYRRSRDRKVAG